MNNDMKQDAAIINTSSASVPSTAGTTTADDGNNVGTEHPQEWKMPTSFHGF